MGHTHGALAIAIFRPTAAIHRGPRLKSHQLRSQDFLNLLQTPNPHSHAKNKGPRETLNKIDRRVEKRARPPRSTEVHPCLPRTAINRPRSDPVSRRTPGTFSVPCSQFLIPSVPMCLCAYVPLCLSAFVPQCRCAFRPIPLCAFAPGKTVFCGLLHFFVGGVFFSHSASGRAPT